MKTYIILSFIGLCATQTVLANVMIPSMVMLGKIHEAVSFYILIVASLIAEFLVLCWLLPQKSKYEIALVAILMNLCSTLLGVFLYILGDIFLGAVLLLPSTVLLLLLQGHSGLLPLLGQFVTAFYVLWYFAYTVLINTTIEFLVAWNFFKGSVERKKLFFYILLINVISVYISVTGVLIYAYLYSVPLFSVR